MNEVGSFPFNWEEPRIFLAEQPLDLLGNPGNDGAIEKAGKGPEQKCAQHHGDDDLHGIRNVKVAASISKNCPCTGGVVQKGLGQFLLNHSFPPFQLF